MTPATATIPVPKTFSSTEEMGRPQWGLPASAHIMASVLLGIEQAKKNEGTFLEDADLATDDDD